MIRPVPGLQKLYSVLMNEFDDMRPYHDDEVKDVLQNLLADKDFLDFLSTYHSPRLSHFFPSVVRYFIRRMLLRQLGSINSVIEFQRAVSTYAERIVSQTISYFDYAGVDRLMPDTGYLFVCNHRDIAGDSMLVNYALWLSGRSTVRIAVGDNLVQRDFATALMKLNKSFFIRRSEKGIKKIYAAILQSSRYIHQSIENKHSIWIAQSEGRAKDGVDITDPTLIKMFALAERKQPLSDIVQKLHIVPVSIAYEYDPCDYIKAKELNAVAQTGSYEKPAGEDLKSLVMGLSDFKGKVYLRFGRCLEGDFHTPADVAAALDRQILDNYQLFFINYWALRELASDNMPARERYQKTWQALEGRIEFAAIADFEARYHGCPHDHRVKWLEMYANPVVNKFRNKNANMLPV